MSHKDGQGAVQEFGAGSQCNEKSRRASKGDKMICVIWSSSLLSWILHCPSSHCSSYIGQTEWEWWNLRVWGKNFPVQKSCQTAARCTFAVLSFPRARRARVFLVRGSHGQVKAGLVSELTLNKVVFKCLLIIWGKDGKYISIILCNWMTGFCLGIKQQCHFLCTVPLSYAINFIIISVEGDCSRCASIIQSVD